MPELRLPFCSRGIALLLLLCCPPLAAQPLPAALTEVIAEYQSAASAPLIPRKELFPEQAVRLAALSPDGRLLLAGIKEGTRTHLSLLDTASLVETPLFDSDRLRKVWWTADSRQILLELDDSVGLLSLSEPQRPAYLARLDRKAGDYVLGPGRAGQAQVLLVRRSEGAYQLEQIGPGGSSEALLRSSSQIEQALAGRSGELFLVLHDAQGRDVYRQAEGQLARLASCGLPVLAACELLSYEASTGTLWLKLNGVEGRAGLFSWSSVTGELHAVHGDPLQTVDLFRTVLSNDRPVAAAYYSAGLQHYALDPAVQPMLTAFEAALPEAILELDAGTNGTWLVKQDAAVLRESRYYLSGPDRQLREILHTATTSPVPSPDTLSPRHYLEYRASDQLLIKAYVSFPRGVELASAPLVALVHGGPWGRVDAGYSHLTQLLVNRGYVVFEPNFRASTGYGRDYVLAAKQDFGNGRVQQDITDGVRYLLAQGIGDPERVAIAGASFGGFSVLSGLAFTPELYRVGVALVPPAELGHTRRYALQQNSAASGPPSAIAQLTELAGDIEDQAVLQRLYQQSPLASLTTIRAPLLLVAGADDDRVDIRQVKDLALRLLNQGNPLSLLIDEDEGHGLLSDDASEASLFLMEEMLALYLGGRKQGLDEPLLQQYLEQRLLLNTNAGFLTELDGATP